MRGLDETNNVLYRVVHTAGAQVHTVWRAFVNFAARDNVLEVALGLMYGPNSLSLSRALLILPDQRQAQLVHRSIQVTNSRLSRSLLNPQYRKLIHQSGDLVRIRRGIARGIALASLESEHGSEIRRLIPRSQLQREQRV